MRMRTKENFSRQGNSATGGKTYSATGSTGDGYEIAQKLGHTIVPVKPSLVPLTAEANL